MAQFGFYMAGGAVAGIGRLSLLIAWNPSSRAPDAVDDIDVSDIALYSWVGPFNSPLAVAKVKSRSPLTIPDENCPTFLDDPNHDYVLRFGIKAGGVGGSLIGDGFLEVFDAGTRAYSITPPNEVTKVELAEGSLSNQAELSMQDRVLLQALEDSPEGPDITFLLGVGVDCREIWRDLMTPNLPLKWGPL